MAEEVIAMTDKELLQILTLALSKVLDWMPEEIHSKAILIPDPRKPSELLAVHHTADGIAIMVGEGYKEFVEAILCEDCQAELQPYSVIYTGQNTRTGEDDPEAYVGLFGAHDEDTFDLDIEMLDDDAESKIQNHDLSKKRILN